MSEEEELFFVYFLLSLMVTVKFTIFMNYISSERAIISGNQCKLSNVANPITPYLTLIINQL